MTVVDSKGYRSSQLRAALRRALGVCLLALVPAAFGQGPSPEAAPQAPQAASFSPTVTVSELHDAYISAFEDAERTGVLSHRHDRAQDDARRPAALQPLHPLPPGDARAPCAPAPARPRNAHLDQLFLSYLEENELEEVVFGINGAVIIRCGPCLPRIKELARCPSGRRPAGSSC